MKHTFHNTYLHCAPKTGWPADHTAEDTFDLPCNALKPAYLAVDKPEYRAFPDGRLVLVTTLHTQVANFGTFADAQLAAEALNNHKGY